MLYLSRHIDSIYIPGEVACLAYLHSSQEWLDYGRQVWHCSLISKGTVDLLRAELWCSPPLHNSADIYVLGHCLLLLGPLVRALLEHCRDPLLFGLSTAHFRGLLNAIDGLDLAQRSRNSGFGFVRASGILRHFARNISCRSSSTRLGCRQPPRYNSR